MKIRRNLTTWFLAAVAAVLTSCADQDYVRAMKEIEQARGAGELTTAEYIDLKTNAEGTFNSGGDWRRAINRAAVKGELESN